MNIQNLDDALVSFLESLNLYQDLVKTNPNVYNNDYSGVYNNLGSLYERSGQFDKAIEAFQTALQIRRSLAEANPEVFKPDLAKTLNNIGSFYFRIHLFDDSLNAFKESSLILEELFTQQPEIFALQLAKSLIFTCKLLSLNDNNQQALVLAEKAYSILLRYQNSQEAQKFLFELDSMLPFLKMFNLYEQ